MGLPRGSGGGEETEGEFQGEGGDCECVHEGGALCDVIPECFF